MFQARPHNGVFVAVGVYVGVKVPVDVGVFVGVSVRVGVLVELETDHGTQIGRVALCTGHALQAAREHIAKS